MEVSEKASVTSRKALRRREKYGKIQIPIFKIRVIILLS